MNHREARLLLAAALPEAVADNDNQATVFLKGPARDGSLTFDHAERLTPAGHEIIDSLLDAAAQIANAVWDEARSGANTTENPYAANDFPDT